jgi:hypothetical protein
MWKRMRLIWLALVAPMDVVESKSSKLLNAMNNIYVSGVEKRLDRVTASSWDLLGIRISHNGDVDTDEVEKFLKRSPAIIKNLIAIIKQ